MSLPVPLSATGGRALQAIIDAPSDTLIATDFDGTLAPIVDNPTRRTCDAIE
jgi:trehalose-6-phosphatase